MSYRKKQREKRVQIDSIENTTGEDNGDTTGIDIRNGWSI